MKALLIQGTTVHIFQDQNQANDWYREATGNDLSLPCYEVELHTPVTLYHVELRRRQQLPATTISTHKTHESAIEGAIHYLESIILGWKDLAKPATIRWDEAQSQLVITDAHGDTKDSSYHMVHIVELGIA